MIEGKYAYALGLFIGLLARPQMSVTSALFIATIGFVVFTFVEITSELLLTSDQSP